MNEVNSIVAGNPAGGDETVCVVGPHKILRPARERADWPPVPQEQAIGLRQICLIDVETTGLDWRRDKVIEVCAARVQVNSQGRIVGIRSIGTGLEDPGHSLPDEIVQLTGLTDEILSGKAIHREALARTIASCEGVIAFNSEFDRSFIEALLPDLPQLNWGCAMKDLPWRKQGLEPGPQNYLLHQCGYYPPAAHRAEADVLSLCQLLDHVCDDGQSVMAKVLDIMTAPAWRFEATWATYHQKDLLRERRYRWRSEGQRGVWHKHIRDGEYQAEWDWHVTATGHEPSVVPLPATERYRYDRSWKPVERQAKVTA